MESKATLLIKNIHQIYTMCEDNNMPRIYKNGFIAIHHDKILDIGVHDFSHHMDKDTRVVDGTNHIAIPAFIEVQAHMFLADQLNLLSQHEFFMRYMHNGTLTMCMQQPIYQDLFQNYHYEIMQGPFSTMEHPPLPLLSHMKQMEPLLLEKFCISCYDEQVSLQNQMLAAQLLAMKDQISPYLLLKALTRYPAESMNLHHLGVLKQGKQANILLLSCEDLHSFFYSLHQNLIAQIIHKGVRIFPNLLI